MKKTPVLIVDDSISTANIVAALVKLCGFEDVDQASDASSAIGKHAERGYGLILADMYMHGMSGIDLLAAVRAGPHRPNVCFVLMTATRNREVIDAAMHHKADAILLKPFTVDGLKQKLEGIEKLQAA
jgi:two-component system chemotaxis response regulator CheY